MRAGGFVFVLCLGCTHTHLEHNAPGRVDIERPPERIQERALERPEDPGERMLVVNYGVDVGGGLELSEGELAYALGPALGIRYGENETSHAADDFFVLPRTAYGINLGWHTLDAPGSGLGPVFAQLEASESFLRMAGGWAWDVDDARHGPVVTLYGGPLFVRALHQLDQQTQMLLGLELGGMHSWIWSR